MGIAMLLLAANYSVHFFYGIRFKNVNAAILMNLSTYFLCYWLFSSALTTLLDRFYITAADCSPTSVSGCCSPCFRPLFCLCCPRA